MGPSNDKQSLLFNNIYPPETISLAKLETWLTRLDNRAPPQLRLKDSSFQKSYNESLGLSKDPLDFTVFIPWSSWDQEGKNTTYPAPLQKNILEVLARGSSDTKTPFVDFASLVPTRKFMLESPDGHFEGSVADAIVQFIKRCDKTTSPVIRFLVGADGSKSRGDVWDGQNKTLFTDIFWETTSDGQYKPRVDHPNATIYVGYYNPDFQPKSDPNLDLAAFMNSVKDVVAKALPEVQKSLKDFNAADYAPELVDQGLRTISWNHGKIVAVNGQVMMTGGGNLWDDYRAEQWKDDDGQKETPNYRIDHNIVDHHAKVVGDAAVSAHHWADYFWNYLNAPAKTDQTSCWWKAKLSDTPNWQSDNMPLEGKKSPFKYSTSNTEGKIPVLTVAKLGDWYGPKNKIDYPTMIIDLARDVMLNQFWQTNAESPDSSLGLEIWMLNKAISDDALTGWAASAFGKDIFNKLGINPTAWASRYTRTQAVAYASSSVIICQQSIVAYLQVKDPSGKYQEKVIDKFNDGLRKANKLTPKTQWDGFIWPFDLLIALAQAVGAIYNSKVPDADPFKGVYIVQTTKRDGDRVDWNDQTAIDRIRLRIRCIMAGLPEVAGGIPANKIDEALSKYLHFRRVMNDDGKFYSHSKIVCVDKKLMYVGSDNAYPCYNEEHGIWVEDGPTVGSWVEGFFKPYWKRCSEVSGEGEWFKERFEAKKALSGSLF